MPYSRQWIDNTPLGTTSAEKIDDSFRQLREDIGERMDDLTAVGGKWTADDPVLLLSGAESIQSSRRYDYVDSQANGLKATNAADVQTILAYKLESVFTDGVGQITINFAELDEEFDINDRNFASKVRGTVHDETTNDYVSLYLVSRDVNAKKVTYSVRKADGGIVIRHALTGILFFYQNTRPS